MGQDPPLELNSKNQSPESAPIGMSRPRRRRRQKSQENKRTRPLESARRVQSCTLFERQDICCNCNERYPPATGPEHATEAGVRRKELATSGEESRGECSARLDINESYGPRERGESIDRNNKTWDIRLRGPDLKHKDSRTRNTITNSKRTLSSLLAIVLHIGLLTVLAVVRQADSEPTIEVTKFLVPSKFQLDKPAKLVCLYQLKGVTLHAMKLFKDNNEFYRYLPPNRLNQRQERKLVFSVPGVQVDEHRSNANTVVLGPLTKQSAGVYKCQVSVEDTFKSVSAEKRMDLATGSNDNGLVQAAASNSSQLNRKSSFFNQDSPRSFVQQLQPARAQQHQAPHPGAAPSIQSQDGSSSGAISSLLIEDNRLIHLFHLLAMIFCFNILQSISQLE